MQIINANESLLSLLLLCATGLKEIFAEMKRRYTNKQIKALNKTRHRACAGPSNDIIIIK